jgi:hypothetical protein
LVDDLDRPIVDVEGDVVGRPYDRVRMGPTDIDRTDSAENAPDTTMPAAATATVNAAQQLYGSATAAAVRQAFVDRGILD